MIRRLWPLVALAAAGAALFAMQGCTTTQERSARLSRDAATAAEAKKFNVGKTNQDITAAEVTHLEGEGAGAVVVRVVNRGDAPQVAVPIGVDLYDQEKVSLYTNRIDGLEPALNMLPVAPPGESWWVNNQIPAAKPARTRVRIGTTRVATPAELPEFDITPLEIGEDAGVITGGGSITNRSAIAQQRLTIFAVARDGDEVVAAGRAVVERVPAKGGKAQKFNIYFTGDPRGADITLFAPPSTLGGA